MSRQKPFFIIYEDKHLIVLNKSAGILSIPDRFRKDVPNLYQLLQINNSIPYIYIVHRLDAETSGAICFAKTKEAHKLLSQQFEQRHVQKIYWALVDGRLREKTGEIDLPLAESPYQRGTMRVVKKGKSALTRYEVLEEFKNFSLLKVQIETGRTHQIRVHLQAIGHPLAVDRIYGQRKTFKLSEVKKYYNLKQNTEERPIMRRASLHAYELGLQHPGSQDFQTYHADLSKDFKVLLKQLRKYNSF